MKNKTNIEKHCICITCNNKKCINYKCEFDCASEEMCECTIDGYTEQCSGYKTDIEEKTKKADEKEKLKKNVKQVIEALLELAEKDGYDDYWYYAKLINGDYIVKTFFEEYFKKKEGLTCCCDKANYVSEAIKMMIQTKNNISLQQTYREYQEKGGNIGSIKELDEIAYWCPKTIKTSKEAIELFHRETIQKWR